MRIFWCLAVAPEFVVGHSRRLPSDAFGLSGRVDVEWLPIGAIQNVLRPVSLYFKIKFKKENTIEIQAHKKKPFSFSLKQKKNLFDCSSSILHVSDGCMEPFIARVPSRSPKLMIPIPSYIMAFPSAEKIIVKINFKFSANKLYSLFRNSHD
jgi:hypothetical protein